jgi:RHS repeat-associated protein
MIRRVAWVIASAVLLLLPAPAAAQDVVEYYGLDAVGSVRVVFDANGTVVGRMDYGPFGEQISASTTGHKSFAGLFRDGEAGLDYAEARMYQPRTGRFNAPDPVYAGLFNPQGWNRYSYALNSPLNFVDPTGLQADACTTVDTYSKDGDNWILNTTVRCKTDGGGGGGGSMFGEFLAWLATRAGDVFSANSVVLGGDELFPTTTGRFKPSPTVETVVDLALVLAAAVATGKLGGAEVVTAAATTTSTKNALVSAAKSAVSQMGPGKGPAYGSKVHSVFRREVDALGLSGVKTEVSYLNGVPVPWGTPGSVRLDAVQYGTAGDLLAVFDLKTGGAVLSPSRANSIFANLPPGPKPPITVIRP